MLTWSYVSDDAAGIENGDANAEPEAECQDCAWAGPESELRLIDDLHQRVMPGEAMPAGECPSCGALAHLVTVLRISAQETQTEDGE